MCIDIVEISLGNINGQILSIFDRVICPGYDSGKVFNIVSRFYLEIIILHHISDWKKNSLVRIFFSFYNQNITPNKRGYPDNIFSYFCTKNICCGYSLEAPGKGLLMSNHNICFLAHIRKISILFCWKKKHLIWKYVILWVFQWDWYKIMFWFGKECAEAKRLFYKEKLATKPIFTLSFQTDRPEQIV